MRAGWSALSAAASSLVFLSGCVTFELEETASTAAPLLVAPATERVNGQYIIIFHDDATAAVTDARDRVARLGGNNRILHSYSVIPGFAAALDEAALAELRRRPDVAYIQEDALARLATTYASPADGIDRVDQRVGHDGVYDDHGRSGAGVHLYVIDTGINIQHDDFAGRIGTSFTSITDDNFGITDCNGHGTHVSSTAAGTRYGIAKQASIHAVRVLGCAGSGTWSGVIAGIDFVRQDCAARAAPCVANLSLSGAATPAVNQAVAGAVDAGITVVVAAGNLSANACNYSPASEPKAITVAAIDDADARAAFSNWGQCVDIFAPGVSILGAYTGGRVASKLLDGTSMASPHVAGVAAQYLSSNPDATPAQVAGAIEGSASIDCVTDPAGSPNLLLYNHLDQGNYHCSAAPASCEGLCGGASDGCFCDDQCQTFGDCCPDYAQICL